MPVSVVLPAYNEEAAVASQVETIRRILSAEGITHEIIVVDDGSKDRTAEEASRARARVIRHSTNRGYGAALKTGIIAATYDAIVITDADATYPPDQIPQLIAKLETADMVVGARVGEQVHIPWQRRPGKWLLGRLANHIAGQPILDLNSGMRAFRRECIQQYFSILSNRFSFTTTSTLALLADDYHVVYHPINYYQRVGESKITPRHFMDFVILVLRMSMVFQPLKVFVPLAFTFGFLGLAKVLFDIAALFVRNRTIGWYLLFEPVLSTSAMLLLMTALQLLLIGMVADGVVRRLAHQNTSLSPSHAVWAVESSAQQPALATVHDSPEAALSQSQGVSSGLSTADSLSGSRPA
jgi:glycosyltransferase involved in cell wall biosynthesis